MRRAVVLAALLAAVAAGCGDDGGDSSTTAPTTTLPPLECPDPIPVASAAELVSVLEALPWEGVGAYTSGPLPITPDLVVTGSVVLEAADLPVPADCLGRPDCSPRGGFRMPVPVAGAQAEGDADLACGAAAAVLTLSDTTVRLRPMLRDTHPCTFNYLPIVEVAPPCGTPCGGGQALCPVDGVCYEAGTGFCQACEGGAKEECACRGPEGPLAEGAHCTFWESGDVRCDGTCRDGVCDAGDCP